MPYYLAYHNYKKKKEICVIKKEKNINRVTDKLTFNTKRAHSVPGFALMVWGVLYNQLHIATIKTEKWKRF